MSDFRQPTPDYMEQERESARVRNEQQFYGAYRRPLNGPLMPAVESEGSAINNPRIKTE